MNKIIISALLLSTFSAFANEAGDDQQNRAAFQGDRTRAEIRADYLNAKSAGALIDTSEAASQKSQTVGESAARGSLRDQAVQAARTRIVQEAM